MSSSSTLSAKPDSLSPEAEQTGTDLFRVIERTVQDTVDDNRWIPASIRPTPKQRIFLGLPVEESLFGGAAGPGKSIALLMDATKYVDYPQYACLILRRQYADLARSGGLMDVAHDWFGGTAARWNPSTHTWHFPSGARIEFGYMKAERDKWNYYGSAYHRVLWDELTQFSEGQYRFLFSRVRKEKGDPIPTAIRAASNPPLGGGIDQGWWVRDWFYMRGFPYYVPARLSDNPYIDQADYVSKLDYLDPITKEKLLNGDWTIRAAGTMFKPEWFEIVDDIPRTGFVRFIRGWDLAASPITPANPDPDRTVGTLIGMHQSGLFYVLHVIRIAEDPAGVEAVLTHRARWEGPDVEVVIEQEPGSSGKALIHTYRRSLPGIAVSGVSSTGSKVVRATPLAVAAKAGNVKVLRGDWNQDWLREIEAFPFGAHDDQVDSGSLTYSQFARSGEARLVGTGVPA